MKKYLVRISCLILVLLTFSACGVAGDFNTTNDSSRPVESTTAETTESTTIDTNLIKYEIPHYVVSCSGRNASKLASEFEETGKLSKVVVNDAGTDYDSMTMYVTEEQREFWIKSRKELLDDLNRRISTYKSEYHIDYSEDCRELSLYYDTDLSVHMVAEHIFLSLFHCELYQIFSQNEASPTVQVNLYNSRTEKLVASGVASGNGMHIGYEEEDWIRSYNEGGISVSIE